MLDDVVRADEQANETKLHSRVMLTMSGVWALLQPPARRRGKWPASHRAAAAAATPVWCVADVEITANTLTVAPTESDMVPIEVPVLRITGVSAGDADALDRPTVSLGLNASNDGLTVISISAFAQPLADTSDIHRERNDAKQDQWLRLLRQVPKEKEKRKKEEKRKKKKEN